MSDRLTPDWTPTSEGAFGETGRVGDQGELSILDIFEDMGYETIHYPDDQPHQVAGVDFGVIIYGNERTFDAKTNLHTGKNVCVEEEKIMKSEADFWIHLNRNDHSDIVFYKVSDMIAYRNNHRPRLDKNGCFWVSRGQSFLYA